MAPEATPKMKAWLVTWEWCGDHARPEDKVAAILNPRLSANHVRDLVEFIYLSAMYTLSERADYARDRKRHNPYPAEFGRTPEGVPTMGAIHCGHNPWLEARLVDHLTVEIDAEGNEMASWKERPKPDLSWLRTRAPVKPPSSSLYE
jgi:hypothetical protein